MMVGTVVGGALRGLGGVAGMALGKSILGKKKKDPAPAAAPAAEVDPVAERRRRYGGAADMLQP